MYENMTYEYIMKRALSGVSAKRDKRQGSIIYDALAGAAAELSQFYIALDDVMDRTYADTSYGIFLEKRVLEQGVFRKEATAAVRFCSFFDKDNAPFDVAVGSVFTIEDVNFKVTERVGHGVFKAVCGTKGAIGNRYFGRMVPADNTEGLAIAELNEIVTPGEEQEDDTTLFLRYVTRIIERPFGGNRADYKERLSSIESIGAVKLQRAWMGGGSVRVYVLDSGFNIPQDLFIDEIQQKVDPVDNKGDGLGIAPMFHVVTISAADSLLINVTLNIQLDSVVTVGIVRETVAEAVSDYFLELRKKWKNEKNTIVRVSAIEQAVLNKNVVLDLKDTALNGSFDNIMLTEYCVPVLGVVEFNEI